MSEFLKIENLPEIDDCLKLSVSGASQGFSGRACCYVNEREFQKFCKLLKGFPSELGLSVSFSSGERTDLSYFTLSFVSSQSSGKVTVNIGIFENELASTSHSSRFSFLAEPAAIDRFYMRLQSVSQVGAVGSSAVLSNET
jgi:hypothetical protein